MNPKVHEWRQRMSLLDKIKVFRLVRKLDFEGRTEREIVKIIAGDSCPQEELDFFRGPILTYRHIGRLPPCVYREWAKKVAGDQVWPLDRDIQRAYAIFDHEVRTSTKYRRAKPGPKFKEFWHRVTTHGQESVKHSVAPRR